MRNRLRVMPRGVTGPEVRFGVPLGALAFALLLGAIILAFAGNDPIEAYRTMFDSSLNGWKAQSRTLALATPLILTGLAAAVAFQMRVYNIGGEGQLYLGAIGASWVGLALPASTPTPLMLSAMLIVGASGRCLLGAPRRNPQGVLQRRRDHHHLDAQLHRAVADELADLWFAELLARSAASGTGRKASA